MGNSTGTVGHTSLVGCSKRIGRPGRDAEYRNEGTKLQNNTNYFLKLQKNVAARQSRDFLQQNEIGGPSIWGSSMPGWRGQLANRLFIRKLSAR